MPNIEGGTNHEQQILDTIQEVEFPLMTALQKEYGAERGWRICGPASIALSRILSTSTGVPISRSLPGEHIEVALGIFDPKDDPNRMDRFEEQTYIRYHVGDGHIYYIDAIYGLLMLERQQLQEAIQVEKYHASTIDVELIAKHNLYPFDPNHEGLEVKGSWAHYKTAQERQHDWEDSVAAMNGKRGTYSTYVADCGHHFGRTAWHRVVPIIKEFAPEFEEDLKDKLHHIKIVTEELMAKVNSGRGRLNGFGYRSEPIPFSPMRTPLFEGIRSTIRPISFEPEIMSLKFKEIDLKNFRIKTPFPESPTIPADTLKTLLDSLKLPSDKNFTLNPKPEETK